MKFKSLFCYVVFCVVALNPFVAKAFALTGTADVVQSSDTAAKAKTEAINLARRQILLDVLSKYADKGSLSDLLSDASNEDLTNFIDSSSVSNEQISSTVYSAKITMNIDNVAVKKWLNENNVQNWIPLSESSEKFSIFIVVPNGISDWAELKRIARENNIEIETHAMVGYQIFAKMPVEQRNKFTIAVRESGWKYADNNGVLQIWK